MLNSIGPNLTEDADYLFQSDRDLALQTKRKQKQETLKSLGNPITLASKVLDFEFVSGVDLITAQSGFIAQRVDIDGNVLQTFKGHNGPVTSLSIEYQNETPKYVLTGSWDKTIKKWDIETGELVYTSTGHDDFVKSVKIFGDKFYSGSSDSRIGIWDLKTGNLLDMVKGHRRAVEDVQITPDGLFLYSCSSDGTVRKWDLKTMEELYIFEGHQTSVYKLILWEDDQLWSVSGDNTAIRWDLETGKKDTLLKHPDFVKSIAVLPSGHIVTGCRDEIIRVFDPANEKCIAKISAHYDEVTCIQYKNGHFYTSSLDGTVRKWQLSQVLESFVLEEEEEIIENIMTEEELAELEELMAE